MPYKVEHRDDKWLVVSEDSGEIKGEHNTEEQAQEQLKALYANVDDAQKSYKIQRRKTGGKIVFDLLKGNQPIAKGCGSREEADAVRKNLAKGDMAQFLTFSKVDDEKRMVYGVATDETPDVDEEVIDWKATKKAAADYSNWRNIREMHDAKAVGTADVIKMDDVNKKMLIGAHISDDIAWKKVKDGVYKGFSIGGKKKAVEVFKDAGRTLTRITDYILTEISLVDRPANPSAVFSIVKRNEQMDDEEKDPNAEEEVTNTETEATASQDDVSAKDDKPEIEESEDEGNSDAEDDVTLIEAIVIKMLVKYGLIKPAEEEGEENKDELMLAQKVSTLQKSMDGLARKSDLGQFAKAGSLGDFAKAADLRALAGDIAKVADAFNSLEGQVELIKKTPRGVGPVLRELGETGTLAADFQTEAAMQHLIEKCEDGAMKDSLQQQLATMQIKKIHANKG